MLSTLARALTRTARVEVELLQPVVAIGDRRVGRLPARTGAHLEPARRIAKREREEGGQAGHRRCVAARGSQA